jgi:hypothetical protein
MLESKSFEKNYEHSRNAAKITLDKVATWDELNVATAELGSKKFSEKTRELWNDFAVHGILSFNRESGERELRPFTDLDGNSAIGILNLAGVDTSNMTYVKPGEYLEGAVNIDTGDHFGVIYNPETYTAFFDHHGESDEISSATEIMYKAMVDLNMLESSPALDRLVDFVNKIDNRKYPPEEFLKSAKTILGLQRSVTFDPLHQYFKDHESPTEEFTPEQFEKYRLREAAERQQKIVDESMETLSRMEEEGKVVQTEYGSVLINENGELKVGSSAAYVRYSGIINLTPDKSFAVTLKDEKFNEESLRQKLKYKFQGKIIRGNMWIYNDKEPLRLTKEEIIEALK